MFQLASAKSHNLCANHCPSLLPANFCFSPLYVKGKCSHGGDFDDTSTTDPVGGISKDDTGSSHGFLHQDAVSLAVNATVELLEDIRLSVGDENFLRC